MPSFTLLGRIGNFSDAEIERIWVAGDREFLIDAVLKKVAR